MRRDETMGKGSRATAATPSQGVVTRVETVTPQRAAELLAGNTRNRRLQQGRVIAMAEEMAAGRWPLTHQGVAVADDGTLLDGQHRLTAVTLAGVEVTMFVTTGLPRSVSEVIDVGEDRRAWDVLAITDGVDVGHSSFRSGVMTAWKLATSGTLAGSTRKILPRDLRAALAEHGADTRAVHDAVGRTHDRPFNAAVLGSLSIAHRTEPAKTMEFAVLLRTGANLPEHHPALALRNHLMALASNATTRETASLRVFNALDAFVRGDKRAFIREAPSVRERYLAPWRKPTT